MKGLLKNNLYGAFANMQVYAGFMILFGIFGIAVKSQSVQISYMLTGIIGFSMNAQVVAKNEYTTKWSKYKLTLPVRRKDIIKSLFLNQMIWLIVGILFVGIELGLSWLIHGCPFDQNIDVLSLFAVAISMGLFASAIFFPLFYTGGEERGEVFIIISLLCAFGLDYIITNIVNDLLEPGTTTIVSGAVTLIVCSAVAFALSYPLTAAIFMKREY